MYDILQLITLICTVAKKCFVSTIPIKNFCMHYWILQLLASLLQMKNFMQLWHLQLLQLLCQLLIYIGTIAINYFCMPYFNSQLLYASLLFTAFVCAIVNSKLFKHYYNSRHLLYVLIQLKMLLSNIATDNFSYTIMIIDFFMHYCNWQI